MIKCIYTSIFIFFITLNSFAQKTDWDDMKLKGKIKILTLSDYKAADSCGMVKRLYSGRLESWTFNASGFTTERNRFDPHSKELEESSRYLYDDNGKLNAINSLNNIGHVIWAHQFYYDKGNQIADSIVDENNKVGTVYRYSYDEQNRCNQMDGYNMRTNGILFLTANYTHDQKGNRIEEVEHFYENGKEDLTIIRTYGYDEKTNQLLYDTYNSGENPTKTKYFYDENGLLTESTWGSNGFVASKSIYKYDKKNNWIEKVIYEKNKPVSVTVRTIEYYE